MQRSKPERILIMGAAGRDFHNFNVAYRDNPGAHVVAFTATQIPDIAGRRYPPELAGRHYPDGIPIRDEADMERLIAEHKVETVVFAYSDVSHETVMHLASRALAAGADFKLQGPDATMIPSSKPVVAICAVRTGCGKSQTTRAVAAALKATGKRVAIIRHPMPYGDLVEQAVQRFAKYADLDRNECTIEEREEYEPHIDNGHIVYAGVDYGAILREAEQKADVVLWDGGNNDLSFYRPDLMITITDPLRAGHAHHYHPGETNLRMADIVVINKTDTATAAQLAAAREEVAVLAPNASLIEAASPVTLAASVAGKRVLVVEDGPTVTHGGMAYGAGYVAATAAGATLVDPRPHAAGSLVEVFERFPHLEQVLPAMGYGAQQVRDLEATINAVECDAVVSGTPIDLARVVSIDRPLIRARYNLGEAAAAELAQQVSQRLFG